MTWKVFIDGETGTTGLQIRERLDGRDEITLLSLPNVRRKDPVARKDMLNAADVAILCLPDAAAHDAAALIEQTHTRVIDASSAHRVAADGWTYGFPEMASGQREAIASASRVSNPGCYPTGFIALMRPLVGAGLVPADWPVSVNAVSGYSGGGRAMVDEFEAPGSAAPAWRGYALNLAHKHVPEMQVYAGLGHPPLFCPAVGRFYNGMAVEIPLPLWALPGSPSLADLRSALAAAYAGELFVDLGEGGADSVDPQTLNGTNRLRLSVFGSDARGQARLVAILDNLGKGAAGAAVQNLNLMLGLAENAGLA
jgi:N-acetyl-gamma-glutamyl-phosphate reductase